MTLVEAVPGVKYEIVSITGENRHRISQLGFNPGCEIFVSHIGFDSYKVVNCRGTKVALAKQELSNIIVFELPFDKV